MSEIPDPKTVFQGELAQNGNWVVAHVATSMFWPTHVQKVSYRGKTIWIIPVMRDLYPAVAMNRTDCSLEDAQRILMQFLSVISWVQEYGILVEAITEGNLPRPFGRPERVSYSICDYLDLSYLPEPADEKVRLALALMREGRGLNHPAYAFLSFYRVLEVAFENLQARLEWIRHQLGLITDAQAATALSELKQNGLVEDIAMHLYVSGRCAVSHANRQPIVNPDEPADFRRLQAELPIVRSLAEHAIESKLGIETRHTNYKKHLYELEGFKKVLGEELMTTIIDGREIEHGTNVEIPRMRIELLHQEPYKPLSDMCPVEIHQDGQTVLLHLEGHDGCARLALRLDFPNERLLFDIYNDIAAGDDGTADGADALAEMERFVRDYMGNGSLRILDAESGELLSRKDAFLPLNVIPNPEGSNARIRHWREKAAERRRTLQEAAAE